MNCDVVYRRDNKWLIGKITNDKLRKKKEIKKLSDVTNTDEYLTLKQWLKSEKSKVDADDILKRFKIERLYIKATGPDKEMVFDDEHTKMSIKEIEKEWWEHLNELCIKCSKKCKQSSRVELIKCDRVPL
jgi:hypothetical protein